MHVIALVLGCITSLFGIGATTYLFVDISKNNHWGWALPFPILTSILTAMAIAITLHEAGVL